MFALPPVAVAYRAVVVVTGAAVAHGRNTTDVSVPHTGGGHVVGQNVDVANVGPQPQGWVITLSWAHAGS